MKKLFLLVAPLLLLSFDSNAQRGPKIGYIDMEYILQNVPDYAQAKNELELKAQRWKEEIEVKKSDIEALKQALKTERVLLTKELIEEREEEIAFQEKELFDYQQKRFGPTGDLVTQKAVLIQPIQDQVFNAAQDIAENRKYDFIFDKSSDLTMLFAAKRYDISDLIVRQLTRSAKREQMSKKELKAELAKEAEEDAKDLNPAQAERQQLLDERKAAREKLYEERKAAADAKREEAAARRQALIDERNAKKAGATPTPKAKSADDATTEEEQNDATPADAAPAAEPKKSVEQIREERAAEAQQRREEAAAKRQQLLDERKANLEEKKRQAQEARDAQRAKQQENQNK